MPPFTPFVFQTVAHQLGPVQSRLSKLEEERQQLVTDREETEAVNRAEVDSLRAEEESVQRVTQDIMRLVSCDYHRELM